MRKFYFLYFQFSFLFSFSQDNINLKQANPIPLSYLEGSWHIQYTNFPKWLKEHTNKPMFNYKIREKGGRKGLDDLVTFVKKGKQRKIKGFDTPMNELNTHFIWRGKGLLRLVKSKWHIVYMDAEFKWAIIAFEKTVFSPAGYDVITKEYNISQVTRQLIFKKMQELGLDKLLTPVKRFDF